jgi:drug/metabolite transporter (DMT)-like permease
LVGLPALAVALTGPGAELVAGHPDGLRGLAAVVVLAVVGTGLALIAFNRIIQRTNALFASTVTYIIPIFAIMWGWLDDEPLTFLHLVGGLVVLAGVRLVNRGGK